MEISRGQSRGEVMVILLNCVPLSCFHVVQLVMIVIVIIMITALKVQFEICTSSSLCPELSPTCTLKWPECNRVQIMCNTTSADHV